MATRLAIALTLSVAAMTQSALAINKCTGPDGKVVFQDRPCSGTGEKVEVRPAAGPAPTSPPAAGPGLSPPGTLGTPLTEAQRINKLAEQSASDRRRHQLTTLLIPGAKKQIDALRTDCQATIDRLTLEQGRYVQNLYGKTHAAQMASEKAAVAATCDTKNRELKDNLDALIKECETLACKH